MKEIRTKMCYCSNNAYENGWKDFGYRMFILLMVSGIITGGIFSLHGQIFGYVLFVIGLVCIPFYIRSLKTVEVQEN